MKIKEHAKRNTHVQLSILLELANPTASWVPVQQRIFVNLDIQAEFASSMRDMGIVAMEMTVASAIL